MESIRIAVEKYGTLNIEDLSEFQGNLKDLSEENYEKLKREILELGFSQPITVWQNKNNKYVLDGHQRLRVLSKMKSEGVKVPKIPVVYVKAKNIKEAKKKVLSLTSQYGNMTSQGLYEFMSDADLTFEELSESFSFPEIDFNKFNEEFFAEEIDEKPSYKKPSSNTLLIEYPNEKEMLKAYKEFLAQGFIVRVLRG